MRSQWQRIFEIDRRVRAGQRPTPTVLVRDLEVSRRQIYYDRDKLLELGAPLECPRGGWIYRDPCWVLPTGVMTQGELLAFSLAVRLAREAAHTPFAAELESAVEKLRRALGDPVSVDLNALSKITFAAPPAMPADDERYLQLSRALEARRKVSMQYLTGETGQTKTRIIHPYHVHNARGELLVFAHDELRQELRTFNIARIQSLQTLEARYQIPLDFDAQTVLDSMLWAQTGARVRSIAIHFDEYQARFIRERTYHGLQELDEQPGGELILRFPASGLAEVARFVLGFGQHARALEPPELVALVAQHVAKLSEIYGGEN